MTIEYFKIKNMFGGVLYKPQMALASEESKEYETGTENWYKNADTDSANVELLQNYVNAAFVDEFSEGWNIEETSEEVASTLTATLTSIAQETTIVESQIMQTTIDIGVNQFLENQTTEGEYTNDDIMQEYLGRGYPLWVWLAMKDES